MAGRPSDYSQDMADLICERITQGESLRAICSDDGMPHAGTVCRWLAKHEAFREQYAHARQAQAELMADELLEIADDGTNDWMEKKNADGENIGWRENGEAMRRSQLRISTRQWIAERLLPKKYGTKIQNEHTGKDGGAIQTEEVSGYDLARRIAFALASAPK
ncbi:terminase small subunit protein [Neorhizobium sp. AL 9.2.2]|uniref:terminase small subunit-like protein n=1 Tax=Neorhizobium sp. AL 9.2.2 TaxID=2712894 RepID=UPI001571EF0E|nr:terminase small subunit protein [Neorhizobium sp. AL 9.2.2]NSY17251.1 terminase small subunit protein [Neorhizobium sp. AL 9.2.2]